MHGGQERYGLVVSDRLGQPGGTKGRCFVLAVGLLMRRAELPKELASNGAENVWVERGGSSIIAPDARYLVEPVFEREELIVTDLDLAEIDKESMTLDVTGHYARPDVFKFEIKRLD